MKTTRRFRIPVRAALPLAPLLLLGACAHQVADAVKPGAPGFLNGLLDGFLFPVAWIVSLFVPSVAIYAVPNNGGWYDFGYFIGVCFLGVGANRTRTVYVERPRRRERQATVIDHEG